MANKLRQSVSSRMRQYANTNEPMDTNIKGSEVILPTDQQSKYSQTIQTHNAVSVPTITWSNGSWIDADGFSELCITFLNDSGVNSRVDVHWSNDGVTQQGVDDAVVAQNVNQRKSGAISIRARYFRLATYNGDTASHTQSAWAYLKA